MTSGVFNAYAVWLTWAVIACNLTRTAALTGAPLGKARAGTIRAALINIRPASPTSPAPTPCTCRPVAVKNRRSTKFSPP